MVNLKYNKYENVSINENVFKMIRYDTYYIRFETISKRNIFV